ncbi:NUDIX domain-containing protein [Shouchella sp. 1P09AA]|uniref:NUDIX hydrolase n=1 Tax=Shouchella sp. 1P09AA TaxID=3132302 RepID=UPI0039A2F73C
MQLTWLPMNSLPSTKDVTSAHGFCFYQDKVMLVHLIHRGWDLPGGHINKGESPEDAFRRECMEEGYVTGECTLLGCVEVNHVHNVNWNETSPYPQIGYQAFHGCHGYSPFSCRI